MCHAVGLELAQQKPDARFLGDQMPVPARTKNDDFSSRHGLLRKVASQVPLLIQSIETLLGRQAFQGPRPADNRRVQPSPGSLNIPSRLPSLPERSTSDPVSTTLNLVLLSRNEDLDRASRQGHTNPGDPSHTFKNTARSITSLSKAWLLPDLPCVANTSFV